MAGQKGRSGGARPGPHPGRPARHTIRGIDAEHMAYLRELVTEMRSQPGMSHYTYAQAVEDLIIQEMWRRRNETS